MNGSKRTMVVLGAVLALGLAACGGGDTEQPPDESPAGQPAEETTTEATATEGAEGDPAEAQAVGQPAEPAKVTYRMTGAPDGGPEELTMSWDPPQFAMLFEDGKMVVTEEGTLFCDAAGEGCFQMGSPEQGGQMAAGALGPFFGFTTALQEGQELPGATNSGQAEIAGRTATCSTYDASAYDPTLQGEAEYCFDAETKVMLRWSATDGEGNTQTVEAIEIGEPDPSDFEPTGPVQEMPQGGGG